MDSSASLEFNPGYEKEVDLTLAIVPYCSPKVVVLAADEIQEI